MNRALVIGSIPFCYQSQAKFLSGILGLNNLILLILLLLVAII